MQTKFMLRHRSTRTFQFVVGVVWALFLGAAFAAHAADKGIPALTITAHNGQTSILIGSMHVAMDGLRQPDVSVLNGKRVYVIEGLANPLEPSPLREIAPEVRNGSAQRAQWSKVLTESEINELRENVRCNRLSIDADTALTFARAIVASDAAMYHCATPGVFSRDALLLDAAISRGISLTTLELQPNVNRQRLAVPERIYRYYLKGAFTPGSREGARRAVTALNTGDYEEILRALKALAENPTDFGVYYKLMVADRNRAWMANLIPLLDAGGAFINVGAAHLPGPEGLIAILRSRGYRVDPILLPAAVGQD